MHSFALIGCGMLEKKICKLRLYVTLFNLAFRDVLMDSESKPDIYYQNFLTQQKKKEEASRECRQKWKLGNGNCVASASYVYLTKISGTRLTHQLGFSGLNIWLTNKFSAKVLNNSFLIKKVFDYFLSFVSSPINFAIPIFT